MDIRRRADHLSDGAAEETPAEAEAKRAPVEGDTLIKIIDVNIDEKFHDF
jgi:hypothetical protein